MNHPDSRGWRRPRKGLFFLLFAALAALAFAGIVMLLWNAVLTPLLHLPVIDYPRALGLFILCRILFGRMGGPGPWNRGGGGGAWRNKWAGMNEEERSKFREEWQKRCADRKGRE